VVSLVKKVIESAATLVRTNDAVMQREFYTASCLPGRFMRLNVSHALTQVAQLPVICSQ
jgi:hypothetical protein